jgi:hypothetical protein
MTKEEIIMFIDDLLDENVSVMSYANILVEKPNLRDGSLLSSDFINQIEFIKELISIKDMINANIEFNILKKNVETYLGKKLAYNYNDIMNKNVEFIIDNNFSSNSNNAWVSPSGVVYICDKMQHRALANEILDELINIEGIIKLDDSEMTIESLGWMKLSHGEWFYLTWGFNRRLTTAQINKLFDWINKYKPNATIINWNNYPTKIMDIVDNKDIF